MGNDEARDMHINNSIAIERLTAEELAAHFGEYAIVVDGKIVSYHPTNREALTAASLQYAYGEFSVQRIEPQPVEMGFADFAKYPR